MINSDPNANISINQLAQVTPLERKKEQDPNVSIFRVSIGGKSYKVKVKNNGAFPPDSQAEKTQETIKRLLEELSETDGYFEQISGKTVTAKIKNKKFDDIDIHGLSKEELQSEKWQKIKKSTHDVFNSYFPKPTIKENGLNTLSKSTPPPPPSEARGIRNLGTSCYINSSIQLLRSLPTFNKMLNTSLTKRGSETDEHLNARKKIQTTLHNLVGAIDSGKKTKKAATEFRQALFDSKDGSFTRQKIGDQLDSSDVTRIILDTFDTQITTKETRSFIGKDGKVEERPVGVPQNLQFVPLNLTASDHPVDFGSLLKDQYLENEIQDPDWKVGTHVPKKYTQKTQIIGSPPEHLPVDLRRFHYQGNKSSKVKTKIDFKEPIDLNDLFTASEKNDGVYSVTSFNIHHGNSLTGGHFTTYRLDSDNTWRHYDDKKATPVKPDEVKRKMGDACTVILKKINKRENA
ncbi:MAG: hypothetical protein WD595_00355 [Waddliaceae bacterium]